MNSKVRSLVLMATEGCGLHVKNALSMIEEQLTISEATNVRAFLTWAFFDWEERMFGHGNINDRWEEWKSSQGRKPKKAESKTNELVSIQVTLMELSTILAALRYFQKLTQDERENCFPDHFAEVKALSDKEIDKLCERI